MSDSTPRLWVATSNPGKVREIEALLAGISMRVSKLPEGHAVVFPEEGDDYLENAVAKARAVAETFGEPAIADDSGIEVEALGGRPGPHSARYGGADLDAAGRVDRLLEEMREVPAEARGARFYCIAALVFPDGTVATREGICPGQILTARRGAGGFGYDPIFMPKGHGVSMAELEAVSKDAISHRGRAIRALTDALTRWLDAPR
jgi:XTP/dITP diphosphohydrolase